jgi:four helix bundle protein
LPTLPSTAVFIDDKRQVTRASGSIGANYIESRESLGKKDSLLRLRISRKEAKECAYVLRLIAFSSNGKIQEEAKILRVEAIEIKNILSSIILKQK